MDDQKQAVVRVNLQTGEIEVRGSEDFVERMLPNAKALAEMRLAAPVAPTATGNGATGSKPLNADPSAMTFSDFVAAKGISRTTSGEDAMTAFAYYIIKEQKTESASKEQILELFERAGIPKPNNPSSTLSNLKARRGFLQSGGRGAYKLTVQGENFVAHEMGATS